MKTNNYIQRKYKDGKIVAYMHKNDSVVRYKLYSIEKKWLTSTLRVKDTYPYRNPGELNKEIDELEEIIDNTISELLYNNSKLYITSGVIDKAIADKEKKAKERGSCEEGYGKRVKS